MSYQDLLDESPGLALRKLVKQIYPLDTDLLNTKTVFKSLDSALRANYELYEIIYESTINYTVRRIVTLSNHLYKKFKDDEILFLKNLRNSLESNFDFPENEFEKIITLLYECAKISGNRHPSGSAKRAYERSGNPRCYICGKTVRKPSAVGESDDMATLDHLWPNALGGNNTRDNLKISCKSCNGLKGDIIDGNDFHYENICLTADQNDSGFSFELTKQRKIALLAKSDFKCAVCDVPASAVGELELVRKNENDTWHYLNVSTRCERHKK